MQSIDQKIRVLVAKPGLDGHDRGAKVIAIVNRRNSDLTDRADGVLYTSDGRDIEMSVASTKAFYSQVVAGYLLAFSLSEVVSVNTSSEQEEILDGIKIVQETRLWDTDRKETFCMRSK